MYCEVSPCAAVLLWATWCRNKPALYQSCLVKKNTIYPKQQELILKGECVSINSVTEGQPNLEQPFYLKKKKKENEFIINLASENDRTYLARQLSSPPQDWIKCAYRRLIWEFCSLIHHTGTICRVSSPLPVFNWEMMENGNVKHLIFTSISASFLASFSSPFFPYSVPAGKSLSCFAVRCQFAETSLIHTQLCRPQTGKALQVSKKASLVR